MRTQAVRAEATQNQTLGRGLGGRLSCGMTRQGRRNRVGSTFTLFLSRSVERAGVFNDQSFPQTHEILRLSAARRLEREWQQRLPHS